MKKRFLSLVLSLVLALSLVPVTALAAETAYDDVAGHWAESAIQRWSGYHIVEGVDGHFMPDQPLTRAAMAKILANTLGLSDAGTENPFSDVPGDAWYAPYILRCHAAGILKGDGAKARPNASISRQEAMVMLCRALSVAEVEQADLGAYEDAAEVAPWARGSVAAMTGAGMVNGVGGNRLAPAAQIDRASILAILDRAVVQYVNTSGQYDLTDKAGTVLVTAGDVTLQGKTPARVLVTRGAGGKSVTFQRGFAASSVTLQSPKIQAVNNTGAPLVMVTMDGAGGTTTAGNGSGSSLNNQTSGGGGSSRPSGGGGGGGGGSSHTHRWDAGTVTTQPTCQDKGVKTYACSGCKTTKTESLTALGHDWDAWADLGENHQRTCKRDTLHTETQPHTWDNGVVTVRPEGIKDGAKVYTCTVCETIRMERLSGADRTFTGGFLMGQVFGEPDSADYVAPLPEDESTIAFYVNEDPVSFSRATLQKYVQDDITGEKLPGAVVEIYVDETTGTVSAIKVFAYSVGKLIGDVETRTRDGVLQIRVPGVVGTWTDADQVILYQNLVEGDGVLYYKTRSGRVVMEKAEKITGAAMADAQGLVVNGIHYTLSALKNMVYDVRNLANMCPGMTWTDEFNEYDFFLDKNGSLVYYGCNGKVHNQVALILAAQWSGVGLQAKLLFGDGTTRIVTISKLEGKVATADAATALDAKVKKAFFNYRVVDGKYEMVECVDKGSVAVNNDWRATVPVTDATIEKVSRFAGNGCEYTANNHTVFLVERDGGQRYDAYTGFRNVPELEHANGIAIADNDNRGVARYVYMEGQDRVYEPEEGVGVVLLAEWCAPDSAAPEGKLEVSLLLADGTFRVLTVSKLDGRPAKADDVAALDLALPKVFYEYRVVGYECELNQVAGKNWSATTAITDAAIEKVSKFAGAACPYTADANTLFLVERYDGQYLWYYSYTGVQNVPEMQHASGIAVAHSANKNVARYVFLSVQQPQPSQPEQPATSDGLVFIYNNDWERDPDNEGMFRINVIGTDGQKTTLSVTEEIKNVVAKDSMDAAAWATNNCVGKFWAITDMDEKGTVYTLTEARVEHVTAMGSGVVTTTSASMDYDNITRFYFVDVNVDDNLSDKVYTDDKMALGDSGEFDPENFFNADDVDPDGTEKTPGNVLVRDPDRTTSFASVKAAIISQDGITADYVYVVRIVW